jgi:hypothetical protein
MNKLFFTILCIAFCLGGSASLPGFGADEGAATAPSTGTSETSRTGTTDAQPSRQGSERSDYTSRYRETYNPSNYAQRYRETYRDNPIYTDSADQSFRNRIRWRSRDYYRPGGTPVPLTQVEANEGAPVESVPPETPDTGVEGEGEAVSPGAGGPMRVFPPMISPQMLRLYYQRKMQQQAEARVRSASEPLAATAAIDAATRSASRRIVPATEPEPAPTPEPARLLTPAEHLFWQGIEAVERADYFNARNVFRNLVSLTSEDEKVQMAYGISLFFLGDYPRAAEALQISSQLTNQNLSSTRELEEWLQQLDAYRYHRQRLQRFIDQHPENVSAATLLLLLPQLPETR